MEYPTSLLHIGLVGLDSLSLWPPALTTSTNTLQISFGDLPATCKSQGRVLAPWTQYQKRDPFMKGRYWKPMCKSPNVYRLRDYVMISL